MQGSQTQSMQAPIGFRRKMVGYMLAHEQFPVPELVRIGSMASDAGFHLPATSDHLQPWQANEGHSGEAWITLGALGARDYSHLSHPSLPPGGRGRGVRLAEPALSGADLSGRRLWRGTE